MTEGQALDYFNAALKHGGLCAGTNYMIDCDDTVWECVVWAGGGIWDVKPNRHENTKAYHELRMFAAAQKRTTFEARTEPPNVLGNRLAAGNATKKEKSNKQRQRRNEDSMRRVLVDRRVSQVPVWCYPGSFGDYGHRAREEVHGLHGNLLRRMDDRIPVRLPPAGFCGVHGASNRRLEQSATDG